MPDPVEPLQVACDEKTGQVQSFKLYGQELLDPQKPSNAELLVNGLPLKTRPYPRTDGNRKNTVDETRLKGERFVDHFSGWGLVVNRRMGGRTYLKHNCFGVNYSIRREQASMDDLPCPGPGGPVIEAPLYVDTLSLLNWNWRFWGDDTRMIFPSTHSSGPFDEFGHAGCEHDTPENCKQWLQNVWRRIYPGVMAVHGGVFYNAKTENWIAITCRRPHVGYIVNIEDAGRGVCYDFTLHSEVALGQWLRMPEIKIYYGQSRQEMMEWLGEYITFYYHQPPDWCFKTLWGHGLAWNNQPTWTQQAQWWEKQLDGGEFSGIGYSLVTNRPIRSGTDPIGYEPDPNHGTVDEFVAMCHRMADRGVPLLTWMSHSGLDAGATEVDDDWFIRGIDGRMCAAWGNEDWGMYHCNPGHPGYIEYTKKWIRFYIQQCRCKGIFFDCLSWAFPPDFRPRSFMRNPGETNLMAIRFMDEIHAYIHELDPEAIMLGEGASIDGAVDIFSIHTNPRRAIDGLGPRDFILQLNRVAPKQMIIDQGPSLFPASGMCSRDSRPGSEARNRYLTKLLKERGGPGAFIHLPGDLSIMDDLLFVPADHPPAPQDIRLPAPWQEVRKLVEETDGSTLERNTGGLFPAVQPGIYKMHKS